MKKTYKNHQTGLVLTVDGPVIHLREGQQESKMSFGDPAFAADLAERLAWDLGATEVKEKAA